MMLMLLMLTSLGCSPTLAVKQHGLGVDEHTARECAAGFLYFLFYFLLRITIIGCKTLSETQEIYPVQAPGNL